MSPHRPARMITWSMLIVRPWGSRQIIRLNLPLKKSSPGQIRRRRTQIDLKWQSRRKKSSLSTKPALANRMIVVCINGRFNMLGYSWCRYTIRNFRLIRFEKAMSYLYCLGILRSSGWMHSGRLIFGTLKKKTKWKLKKLSPCRLFNQT